MKLVYGARVRAKVATIGGWKGTGTYLGGLWVLPDDRPAERERLCTFAPEELTVMRDQTPNPAHAEAVSTWGKPYNTALVR